MQSGTHRVLYDGPISAKDLRGLKPHAGCFGKKCRKITLKEEENAFWHIHKGKPFCDECFKQKL